jgi:hypothetical protein
MMKLKTIERQVNIFSTSIVSLKKKINRGIEESLHIIHYIILRNF